MKKKSANKKSKEDLEEMVINHDLTELAEKLDIQIVVKKIEESNGGLCRLKNKMFLFINDDMTVKDKNILMAKEISKMDLGKIFIKPALRLFIEKYAQK